MARKPAIKLYASDSLGMQFDSSEILANLLKFSKDVQEKAMRPAMYAATTVLYSEIVLRAPEDKGDLKDAAYRWRDKTLSENGIESWVVGINKVKAPHYHLVEHGHWQTHKVLMGPDGKFYTTKELLPSPKWIPPQAFFRPAYDAKINTALQVALERLKFGVSKLV